MPDARGYTLVELLIIIGIIGILVTFGFSGFAKAQERQAIQSAKESILGTLQQAQKASYVGDKDCGGALTGIEVQLKNTSPASIITQSVCSGTPTRGTAKTVEIKDITFTANTTITFRPLEQGVTLPTNPTTNINYKIGTRTFQVTVTKPGIIKYAGEI